MSGLPFIALMMIAWCLVVWGGELHIDGRKHAGTALIALGWGVWVGSCITAYVT